jgi:hypothetical protein
VPAGALALTASAPVAVAYSAGHEARSLRRRRAGQRLVVGLTARAFPDGIRLAAVRDHVDVTTDEDTARVPGHGVGALVEDEGIRPDPGG